MLSVEREFEDFFKKICYYELLEFLYFKVDNVLIMKIIVLVFISLDFMW